LNLFIPLLAVVIRFIYAEVTPSKVKRSPLETFN